MPDALEAAQVRHIARLARLDLSADEVTQFARQLPQILDYFRTLERVNTAGVEPLAHVLPMCDVWRDDVPTPGLDQTAALANAPARDGPFFRVPRVLDPDSGA